MMQAFWNLQLKGEIIVALIDKFHNSSQSFNIFYQRLLCWAGVYLYAKITEQNIVKGDNVRGMLC